MKISDLYGIIGSAVFCGLLLLLLLLVTMPGQATPEDEGIIVSFGNTLDGGGRQAIPTPSMPQPEQQAEERRLAEEQRKQQEAIDKANALGSMFGTTVAPDGSGTDESDARQGNPVGKGSSEGHSWSLDGRTLVGKIAKPNYNRDVEGIITVNIRVDENGNVTNTSIGRPTTISDGQTQREALEAARKTKFSAGKNAAIGTISYNLKLK